jgi:hypothetical protein
LRATRRGEKKESDATSHAVPGSFDGFNDTAVLDGGSAVPTITLDSAAGHIAALTFDRAARYTLVAGAGGWLGLENGANLGILTAVNGGALSAPNGISLGVGCNLSGSGAVNAKIAAGFGSTILAMGDLLLGNPASSVGFASDGELYVGANTVTIADANDAVLGSLTRLGHGAGGGRLIAATANPGSSQVNFLLNAGKNLEGRGVVSGNFRNHGHVAGDGTSLDARIVFDGPWTVSGDGTFENTLVLGTFAPGNSPGVVNGTSQGFGGTLQFELGGTTPGFGDGHYDQVSDSAAIVLTGAATLSILPWNGFVPTPGQEFEIMTWQSGLSGTFGSVQVDPWFTSHGISFNVAYHNVAGAGDLTITAVPEPSTLVLLGALAVGLLVCLGRRGLRRP